MSGMKKMEFSKIITVLSWAVALILTALSCAGNEGAQAALSYSWAEVTAVQAFYLWKAKNENRHKYAMLYVDQVAEKCGMETALRMAEIVLKD